MKYLPKTWKKFIKESKHLKINKTTILEVNPKHHIAELFCFEIIINFYGNKYLRKVCLWLKYYGSYCYHYFADVLLHSLLYRQLCCYFKFWQQLLWESCFTINIDAWCWILPQVLNAIFKKCKLMTSLDRPVCKRSKSGI